MRKLRRKAAITLVWAVLLPLAACSRFSGPESVVRKAFDSYRANDSNAISELMSRQGLANAATYCGGNAINCLRANYAATEQEYETSSTYFYCLAFGSSDFDRM